MKFEYLIIAGGKVPPIFFVKKLIKSCKNIITVDRGASLALKLKLKPLLHVGDNDSFSQKLLKKLKSKSTIQLEPQKSISDLEYALGLFSDRRGLILVIGAHGEFEGRHDHAFINMVILQHSENIYFADEKNWITSIPSSKKLSFLAKRGTVFSLISPHSKRNVVHVTGAKYEGRITLNKFSHGLSNIATGSVRIKARLKTLLFVSSNLTQTKIDDSRFTS